MENLVRLNKPAKKRVSEIVFICVMLALPIASFLIFWLYVNFSSILMAFQEPVVNEQITWTMQNFIDFFNDLRASDSIILPALKNTLIFFFCNVFIVIPVAVFMSYFIYKKIFMFRFFRFVFFMPSIIMATVLVVLFKYIIEPGGPIANIVQSLGKEPILFLDDERYALNTILFYTIFTTFGGNLVLLGGAINSIDKSIIEAGVLDGVGITREIFQIIVPIIWPTLSTMILLATVGIFTASGPVLLFTQGANGTNTISYWIYSMVSGISDLPRYEYASAVGLVFTLIGLPIVLLIKKLLNAAVADVEY